MDITIKKKKALFILAETPDTCLEKEIMRSASDKKWWQLFFCRELLDTQTVLFRLRYGETKNRVDNVLDPELLIAVMRILSEQSADFQWCCRPTSLFHLSHDLPRQFIYVDLELVKQLPPGGQMTFVSRSLLTCGLAMTIRLFTGLKAFCSKSFIWEQLTNKWWCYKSA